MKIITFCEVINIDLFEHVYMSTKEYNGLMFGIALILLSSFSEWFHVCQINSLIDSSTPTITSNWTTTHRINNTQSLCIIKEVLDCRLSIVPPLVVGIQKNSQGGPGINCYLETSNAALALQEENKDTGLV